METARRRLLLRWLAPAVVVVLSAVSVAGWAAARRANIAEEHALLRERANEIVATFQTSLNTAKVSLGLLGDIYLDNKAVGHSAFDAGARSLLSAGTTTIGIAQKDGDRYVVRVEQGGGVSVGQKVSGAIQSVARRTATSKDLVTARGATAS